MTITIYDPGQPGDWKESVLACASVAPAAYARVGNVITAAANGVLPNIDTVVAPIVGSRILLALAPANADNGIYVVTSLGAIGARWTMQRASDCDVSGNVSTGMRVPVEEGTVWGQRCLVLATTGAIDLNTTPLLYVDGGAFALCTAALDGTVNEFGATANATLQSDAATPGGVWRADTLHGAAPAAVGSARFSQADTITWRDPTGAAHDVTGMAVVADQVGIGTGAASVGLMAKTAIGTAGAFTSTETLRVGGETQLDGNVHFISTLVAPNILQRAPVASANGTTMAIAAQPGGVAAIGVGGTGGPFVAIGGTGGNGTAALAAGRGGIAYFEGGSAGTNNGGGGNDGADAYLNGGEHTGAGVDGTASLGSLHTSQVWIGCAATNSPISQLGTGLVTWNGNLAWASTTVAPQCVQIADNGNGVTCDNTTFKAQSASLGGAASVGGSLILGGGDTAGTLASSGGSVAIEAGDATAAGVGSVGGNVTITPGHAATHGRFIAYDADGVTERIAWDSGGSLTFNSTSTMALSRAGVAKLYIAASTTTTFNSLAFDAAVVSPELSQGVDATATTIGDTLAIQAQSTTNAATICGGGALALKAGNTAGITTSFGGSVAIEAGDATAAGVGSVGGNVTITPGTGATGGTASIRSSAALNTVTVTAGGNVQLGPKCSAPLTGQVIASWSQLAALGDAQRSSVSLSRISTDAGPVELTLTGAAPGAGTRLTVPANKLYRFSIELSCICTAGGLAGSCGTWGITGAIKNIAGATAIVGVVTTDATAVDAALAAATAIVTADDGNDCMALTCTGVDSGAENTYHWHAAVYLSEVA